jgi:ubiquinone biosynthesis protein COQ4
LIKALSKFRLGLGFLKLVNNPNRPEVVFDMADQLAGGSMDHPAIRSLHEATIKHPEFVQLYESNYRPKKSSLEELHLYPEGSLGRRYAEHLTTNGLDPDFYRDVEQKHLVTYLGQRMRETHDILHVLTGFDTSVPGEAALQAFSLAQIGSAINAILVAAGILNTIKTSPGSTRDVMDQIVRGYSMGRQAKFLPAVRFDECWETPISQLQADLNITPLN